MSALTNIAGIVLAGGESRRMGGGDKCLLPLGEVPVLAHVIARLRPQVSALVINANDDPSRFAPFGLPVIADRLAGSQGPLAGVEAGLAWAAEEAGASWAVTVPGDTPFIPRDHPVAALWPVSMRLALARALEEGERKASRWVKAQGATEVFFDAVEVGGERIDPFFNINRPEDLETARTLAEKASAP